MWLLAWAPREAMGCSSLQGNVGTLGAGREWARPLRRVFDPEGSLESPRAGLDELATWRATTLNASSLGPLLDYLGRARGEVVFAQELHVAVSEQG